MKPFDIEAAKKGAKVCTFEGDPVHIVSFDERLGEYPYPYSIVAIINSPVMNIVTAYREDGSAPERPYKGSRTLLMADDDYKEKLERGEYDRPKIAEEQEKLLQKVPPFVFKIAMYLGMVLGVALGLLAIYLLCAVISSIGEAIVSDETPESFIFWLSFGFATLLFIWAVYVTAKELSLFRKDK